VRIGFGTGGQMAGQEELQPLFDTLAAALDGLPGVTGIDIGVRDESEPSEDDLAVRVFVRDGGDPAVRSVTDSLTEQFQLPIVVQQRVFFPLSLPDTAMYRPVAGGVSVCASRFAGAGGIPVGTMGGIARTTRTLEPLMVGISNHHVLCFDGNRSFGDEIIQPQPDPGTGQRLPDDRVGALASWSFPEVVYEGVADAAIFTLEKEAFASIVDIGATTGTATASMNMQVTKRGRTSGQTFGWVSAVGGSYKTDYSNLPPVGNPPTVERKLVNQIQVHIDFPLTVIFLESGDSGALLLESATKKIIGLLYAGGALTAGDPIESALATPIDVVENELGITFTV
jgi:hypothetical protein